MGISFQVTLFTPVPIQANAVDDCVSLVSVCVCVCVCVHVYMSYIHVGVSM